MPSIFSVYPSYLQPKTRIARQRTKRRKIGAEGGEFAGSSAVSLNSESTITVSSCNDLNMDTLNVMPMSTNLTPRKKALKSKIKNLQQKIRRRNTKISSMSELIKTLSDKKFISDDITSFLDRNFSGLKLDLIKNEIQNVYAKPQGSRYSDAVKQFALTLYYYSPKAYAFVRSILQLPHPSSLQNWCKSVNCKPGFLSEVLEHLRMQTDQNPAMSDCALIIDSMSIRKQIIYNRSEGKYVGYVDTGTALMQDYDIAATEALTFMLIGLKTTWKFPIAYFLVDHVSAHIQEQLITVALSLCANAGLRVWSVTCDGTASNVDTLRRLGCSFGSTFETICPTFKHPTKGYDVYAIFDVCHMIKLARNAFSDMGKFVSEQGEIDWNYIKMLFDLQEKEGLHLANRISLDHVHWHNHKMKVKLAVQVLSSSVADALQFLQEIEEHNFISCSETVEFIRCLDRLFDTLNSHSQYGKGFKRAITSTNIDYLYSVCEKLCRYLLTLKLMHGELVINSKRKTFVLGFCVAVKSIFGISKELLASGAAYVPTYRFSQDHIEILFSCIRQKGGWNNNPNCVQFQGALRRLLIKNSVTASKVANCAAPGDSTMSSLFQLKWSRRKPAKMDTVENLDDMSEDILFAFLDYDISIYKCNVLFYIAGFLVKRIAKTVSCEQCSALLFYSPSRDAIYDHNYQLPSPYAKFLMVKNKGGLVIPAVQVYEVLLICETVFRAVSISDIRNIKKSKLVYHVVKQVLARPVLINYFHSAACDVDFAMENVHGVSIIKKIADLFFDVRLFYYSKKVTQSLLKNKEGSKRFIFNKLILFSNQ